MERRLGDAFGPKLDVTVTPHLEDVIEAEYDDATLKQRLRDLVAEAGRRTEP